MIEPAPAHEAAAAHRANHLAMLFATLMLIMLLASLSQMILSTALPTIVGELNGVDAMMWVITAYMLTSTIAMPVYGRSGDLLGRKPMLLTAITVFLAGSVLAATAESMGWLTSARAIQGLGGGGLMLLSQASIADFVPPRERGRYVGLMGAVFAVASVAGPLIGGWLTEGPGWRWAFWLNVPLGLLAMLAIVTIMPTAHVRAQARPRIDVLGIALLSLTTTAIILVAVWGGNTYDWVSPQILGLAAAGIVLGAVFLAVEDRAEHPVIPQSVFRNRNFVLATAAALATALTLFGVVGYLPTYFQMAEGVSATEAGLLMIAVMGPLLVTSIAAGAIVSRTGRYKAISITGSLVLAAGLWLLSRISLDTPLSMICLDMAVMGVGVGCNMQMFVLIVQNEFAHKMVGTATAANNYFRQVGSSLGAAVVGSVFVARLTSLITERLPQAATTGQGTKSLTPESVANLPEQVRTIIVHAYNDALVPVFVVMAPLALIAATLLAFLRENPLATEIEHEIPAESLAEGQILITELDDEDAEDPERARGRHHDR